MRCLKCQIGIGKGSHPYCKRCWARIVWANRQNRTCPACGGQWEEGTEVIDFISYHVSNPNAAIVACDVCWREYRKKGMLYIVNTDETDENYLVDGQYTIGQGKKSLRQVAFDMGANADQVDLIERNAAISMEQYLRERNYDVPDSTSWSAYGRRFYKACREVLGETPEVLRKIPKEFRLARDKKILGSKATRLDADRVAQDASDNGEGTGAGTVPALPSGVTSSGPGSDKPIQYATDETLTPTPTIGELSGVKGSKGIYGPHVTCDRCGDVGPCRGRIQDYPEEGDVAQVCKECWELFGV